METDPKYMTPAERMAAHLKGEVIPFPAFRSKSCSFRLPTVVVGRIDAFAAKAGLTRTETVGLLVAAGFYASLDLLPAGLRAELEAEAQHLTHELNAQGDE